MARQAACSCGRISKKGLEHLAGGCYIAGVIEFFLVMLFVGTMLPAGIHEEWLAAGGALRWLWVSLATVGTLSALALIPLLH